MASPVCEKEDVVEKIGLLGKFLRLKRESPSADGKSSSLITGKIPDLKEIHNNFSQQK